MGSPPQKSKVYVQSTGVMLSMGTPSCRRKMTTESAGGEQVGWLKMEVPQ